MDHSDGGTLEYLLAQDDCTEEKGVAGERCMNERGYHVREIK